jgi:hypothetical protein
MGKIGAKILFFLVVFCVAFSVWYSPVVFKGYVHYKIKDSVLLARNLHNVGVYSTESKQNIFLAPSLAKEKGEIASSANKLTAYLYAGLFKITGVLTPRQLVLFSVFLNSLAILIFAAIVYFLFGPKITGLFSLIYILLPFNWLQIYSIGTYEFATFFLSLFFLFFVLSRGNRYEPLLLFFAGIFLIFAAMAKEVFLLLAPILFVYFWLYRKQRLLLPLFIPVVLILAVFYVPSFFSKSGGNAYSELFFSNRRQQNNFSDFTVYSHLYPDPYTYHFEKNEFLKSYNEKINQAGFLESLKMKKVLGNLGERGVRLWERFFLGDILLLGHLGYFISLEEAGGPFVLFFALLGAWFYLRRKDRDLFRFFCFWFLGTLFLLSYVVLVARNHLMDFSWAISLLVSLGVFYLVSLFGLVSDKKAKISDGAQKDPTSKNGIERKTVLLSAFLVFTVLYSIFLADHIVFGKIYDKENVLKTSAYAREIKNRNISDNDVIAVGLRPPDALVLNYLSGKSLVVFSEKTVKKLLYENRLKKTFEGFGVKYILGYDNELSEEIGGSSMVANIASSTLEVRKPRTSFLGSFLLNLVR